MPYAFDKADDKSFAELIDNSRPYIIPANTGTSNIFNEKYLFQELILKDESVNPNFWSHRIVRFDRATGDIKTVKIISEGTGSTYARSLKLAMAENSVAYLGTTANDSSKVIAGISTDLGETWVENDVTSLLTTTSTAYRHICLTKGYNGEEFNKILWGTPSGNDYKIRMLNEDLTSYTDINVDVTQSSTNYVYAIFEGPNVVIVIMTTPSAGTTRWLHVYHWTGPDMLTAQEIESSRYRNLASSAAYDIYQIEDLCFVTGGSDNIAAIYNTETQEIKITTTSPGDNSTYGTWFKGMLAINSYREVFEIDGIKYYNLHTAKFIQPSNINYDNIANDALETIPGIISAVEFSCQVRDDCVLFFPASSGSGKELNKNGVFHNFTSLLNGSTKSFIVFKKEKNRLLAFLKISNNYFNNTYNILNLSILLPSHDMSDGNELNNYVLPYIKVE